MTWRERLRSLVSGEQTVRTAATLTQQTVPDPSLGFTDAALGTGQEIYLRDLHANQPETIAGRTGRASPRSRSP